MKFYMKWTLLLMTFLFLFIFINKTIYIKSIFLSYSYIFFNASVMYFSVKLSELSIIVMSMIMFIGLMINVYSDGYLKYKSFGLYLFILNVFILSMLLVIISSNFILFILGWDGLGISSFMLVAFYNNKASLNNSMVVFLINRLSDVCLLIVISLLFLLGDTSMEFCIYLNANNYIYYLLMSFIFMACIIKSAQLPFSKWLPLAMSAPTPVSSLVHSSTLVVAGAYLFFQMLEYFSESYLLFLSFLSVLTALTISASVYYQYDLKKNIAYTTIIQLSYMFIMVSLSVSVIFIFHIILHAVYKCTMFMLSGLYMYFNEDKQSLMMGLSYLQCPYTYSLMIISNLASWGIPFLSSFYSKDLMLDVLFCDESHMILVISLYMSLLLSVMSSMNLIYLMVSVMKSPVFFRNSMISMLLLPCLIMTLLILLMGATMSWLMKDWEIFKTYCLYKIIIIQLIIFGVFLSLMWFIFSSIKWENLYMVYMLKVLGSNFMFTQLSSSMFYSLSKNSYKVNEYWLPMFLHNYFLKMLSFMSKYFLNVYSFSFYLFTFSFLFYFTTLY
uniref:NADH:ubiquinone reductase (H(+)-translocating) n=1 Tax=Sacculina sp. 'Beibu Gulf' TaxID=2861897 RepID=A0A8F9RAA9_9CRUS|nr:NADH dehydrogenase subunit 5 [Sacculina sp. 'Beibu Gulf']